MLITKNILLSLGNDNLNQITSDRSRIVHCNAPSYEGREGHILLMILDFCKDMDAMQQKFVNHTIIVDPAKGGHKSVVSACLLLGAYLILRRAADVDNVIALFGHDQVKLDVNQALHDLAPFRVIDCWSALKHAVQHAWISECLEDEEPLTDLAELLHYSRAANGNVHAVIPGKLLFFATPDDSLRDVDWADGARDACRTTRTFSPAFTAALLHDLGVSAVACLGTGSAATADALARHGIEAADLGLAADGSSLLRGLDRLLSLAAGAPGAVAVHSGDAGGGWPGYAGTLAKALLISRAGMGEGAAGAWLGLACPWLLRGACGSLSGDHRR